MPEVVNVRRLPFIPNKAKAKLVHCAVPDGAIMSAFILGHDTKAIASRWGVSEASVANRLAYLRDQECTTGRKGTVIDDTHQAAAPRGRTILGDAVAAVVR